MPEPRPAQSPALDPREPGRVAPRKRGLVHFIIRHPSLALFLVFLLLLSAFIGQNLEATSIDFLFWTLFDVPKIVMLFLGVPVGALGWELLRRAFR